ncbi:d-ribitol-5-phosphate cytidylyltransferase [Caerostris extrusa]|uniref:D-ribitol-5-phosphate cytidylyltransferase n=1 Tax=Caerostris extrusa TaxID=172846 RepID=A0AAV4QZ15_CAEEX|nr:d-ribitol-5-phosphate cytidylyltransferase [Caerostris extrusa]
MKLLEIDFEVCAIIPAAGTESVWDWKHQSSTFPSIKSPSYAIQLMHFFRIPFIKKIVVVAAPNSVDLMLQTLTDVCTFEGDKLMISEGSSSRHQSIQAGLKALKSYSEIKPEVVIIHDGVRPFFPEDIISKVVLAAKRAWGSRCNLSISFYCHISR